MARLFNKLEHIGSPLAIVVDDAFKVGAKFDGPFCGVIRWRETVDELPPLV